ncbi:metabotropic glutamate receptor 4-like [Biomphalaria glabrata]|uniref:Metabotropic glutamate receptor 4-like n=2 Tax=Biomphalaria glabrata TaxID=6526 RepID=A0A9W2YYL8_BIOGL|nr:metabotropic glutamate receptor 4-like [Biomphalaria glabrata]
MFRTKRKLRKRELFIPSLIVLSLIRIEEVGTIQPVPGLSGRAYKDLGDVNLGVFFAITKYDPQHLCGDELRFPLLQQYIEAIVYAVDEINRSPALLPNITLGYAIVDDCVKESAAVAQALRFLPRRNCTTMEINDNSDQYDVVGVIGPERSDNSLAVSLVLGPVKIPQISFLSSSDELSNKDLHSYFLRMIPPDRQQVDAILTFIQAQKWTYVSIIFSAGSYGESAYLRFKQRAEAFGICLAVHRKTTLVMTSEEYVEIIEELLQKSKARVVVAFIGGEEMVRLFQQAHSMNVSKQFIWIGSDGWSERLTILPIEYQPSVYGSFSFQVSAREHSRFNDYFDSLRPNCTKNPWFQEFWEWAFDCSFKRRTCDDSQRISQSSKFYRLGLISKAIDTVYVYGHAMHNLIADKCPQATGEEASECIKKTGLLDYLRNVSFEGSSGYIQFDDNYNLKGYYEVRQNLPGNPLNLKPVCRIDLDNDTSISVLSNYTWEYVSYAGWPNVPPESVCSPPCGVNEYKVPDLVKCCWDCRECRKNEIVFQNGSSCQVCPKFNWPDPLANFTRCSLIEPTSLLYTKGVVIFEMAAIALGLVTTVFVLIAFIYYKEASIIKAASRELSFLQLIAIMLGFVTILLYVLPPTDQICSVAYCLFCFSLNLLHAPLLVKAIRIYRIFLAPSKCARGLRFISPFSQVVISCLIVLGQVIIVSIVTTLQKPRAMKNQLSLLEREVELSCHMSPAMLVSFLSYNLTIVLLSSVFAFKTRMVPDNFNESRFISVCVTTTLVVWVAFIPTYIHSAKQYLKTLLLTLALLMNHSLALTFLFLSKLFAILYYNKSTAAVNPAEASPAPRFKLSLQHSASYVLPYATTNGQV